MYEIIWQDLKGHENDYKISNEGKIISKNRNKEKTIFKRKPSDKLMVGLNKDGKTYTQSIDKLLYENFGIEYNDYNDLEGEIWEYLKGCEGRYQVSNKGRIKSLDRYIDQTAESGIIYSRFMKGRLLSLERDNSNGYLNVQLPDGVYTEKEENFYIHQLVAQTFILNPENKPEVNHKDGHKDNNSVENLEWVTSLENTQHAWDTGLSKIPIRKLNKEQAQKIYELSHSGLFSYQIAEMFNISKSTVKDIKNKRAWKQIHNVS